jgi:tetratricopeptide (TPR) repeat protein
MMNIVLVILVGLETIGLAMLWSRYNRMAESYSYEEEIVDCDPTDDDWFYNGEEWLYKGQTIDEMLNDYRETLDEEETIEEETEDYDYFRYNYKAVLEADIEEIYERMTQALEEADFDTYDELEKDYNSLIEQLKSELVIEEQLASVK